MPGFQHGGKPRDLCVHGQSYGASVVGSRQIGPGRGRARDAYPCLASTVPASVRRPRTSCLDGCPAPRSSPTLITVESAGVITGGRTAALVRLPGARGKVWTWRACTVHPWTSPPRTASPTPTSLIPTTASRTPASCCTWTRSDCAPRWRSWPGVWPGTAIRCWCPTSCTARGVRPWWTGQAGDGSPKGHARHPRRRQPCAPVRVRRPSHRPARSGPSGGQPALTCGSETYGCQLEGPLTPC